MARPKRVRQDILTECYAVDRVDSPAFHLYLCHVLSLFSAPRSAQTSAEGLNATGVGTPPSRQMHRMEVPLREGYPVFTPTPRGRSDLACRGRC